MNTLNVCGFDFICIVLNQKKIGKNLKKSGYGTVMRKCKYFGRFNLFYCGIKERNVFWRKFSERYLLKASSS